MPLNPSELVRRLEVIGVEAAPRIDAKETEEDYSVAEGVHCVAVDTTDSPVTVTLPRSPDAGQTIIIKKLTANANTLTINGNGKLIDGLSSIGTGATIDRVTCHLWYWDGQWRSL
jgi:hypothetical protein